MKVLCVGITDKHISFIKKTTSFLFILIVIVSFASCTNSKEFIIGDDLVNSRTNLQIVDTFRVDLSTVLLDSLPTSGSGMILVGNYQDSIFGSVKAQSYFEPGFRTFGYISDLAVYDSAAFHFGYAKYSYGDTTQLMTFNVRQLSERITLNISGSLYNIDTVPYAPLILGSKSFYPSPNNSADTTISVPVNNFGKELFDLIVSNDENFTTSDLFLAYIKGFCVTSSPGANHAIIGFRADTSHLKLKIYYHISNSLPNEAENSITIPFGAKNVQFNNVQYDLSKTPLSTLNQKNNAISASKTGNKAFLMGMVGLMPKIQFPTMQSIFLANNFKVVKAQLILAPVNGSFSQFLLPHKLALYNTDKLNGMNSILANLSGSQVTSSLVVDNLYNIDTQYTFDITNYITSELADSYFDYDHGILVGLPGETFLSTLGRMEVENKNPAIMLRLYYLTY